MPVAAPPSTPRLSGTPALLWRMASAAPILAKLRDVREHAAPATPVHFDHVTESARSLLCGLLAKQSAGRLWILCENVRAQETLHSELLNWLPSALFFPETEALIVEGAVPDPEIAAERLEVLQQLAGKPGKNRPPLILTAASLENQVPSPKALQRVELRLARGQEIDREKLLRQLADAGYEHVPQVALRGQYAVRGGILDLFSFQHPLPVRLEFFGDEIDSIRQFDLDAQTSVQHLEKTTLLLDEATSTPSLTALSSYLAPNDLVVAAGFEDERAHVRIIEGAAPGDAVEDFSAALYEHGLGEFEAGDLVVDEIKRERFFAQLRQWRQEKWAVHIFCNNEGEIERLQDLIPPVELDPLTFTVGSLARGFTCPAAKLAVLSDAELFGRYRNARARRAALRKARDFSSRSQIDYSELVEGDYVVHLEHGIGRYEGMKTIPKPEGAAEEVLVLGFANDSRLYVPLEQSYLVSRYVGVGKRHPALSELGDAKWAKAKQSAEKSVMDYAARLLRHHAERETQVGFAFPPDSKWQREFESSFLYQETPDQVTAIHDTKTDMESEQPMDRLICGDVGFGKTEVAIRAAFKAVMGGKQVAMLVPTTVLAEQHYRNFRERMSDYPVTVELLSRFRTQKQQNNALKGLASGQVDIIIGTHRLISKDVSFHNLGLVIIDEEQRFGVVHKEKFKELFRLVDMLTLSATPIPRTLYLSLMGAKDMSTIETPPPNRVPVETTICGYDERIIRDAINRELARQGQVYFLHNRIETIERTTERLQLLVPKARIVWGHGQMEEHQLEVVMKTFVEGRADILVSTTIIESGLDIPNANTIIIDRADRFGLADLYQLRGRVGRANQKAYAYLMLPRDLLSVTSARKRINAIKQYSSLGAGFKIAMRDLEIRGAGNILGTAQSGHIITVGFDLYCSLLRQAVATLKGEKVKPRLEVALRLEFITTREANEPSATPPSRRRPSSSSSSSPPPSPARAPAYLPTAYVADSASRIQAYRRLNEIITQEQLDQLRKTWRDRFGPLPPAAEHLLLMTEIKLSAAIRQFSSVEVKDEKVMLQRNHDYVLLGAKFPRLSATDPGEKLHELLALVRSF